MPTDLDTCDREPIRVPGQVQPHGVLLVVRGQDLRVAQASANTADHFGRPAADLLGRPLAALFGAEPAAALGREIAAADLDDNPLYLRTLTAKAGPGHRAFRAVAHRHDGNLILELEPADAGERVTFQNLYPVVRSFVAGLEKAAGVDEVCRLAAVEVRRITGFDRVMVYRFDPDWNGRVVAEDRADDAASYLGHHFPASDIPAQARDLYRLNRFRLIPDAGYTPVPLVPAEDPDTGKPLDLSFAALRSVSPVHCEYLRNMGVVASMSVSVVRAGELWALIACHHRRPRTVSTEARAALELLGQMLANQVSAHEQAADIRRRIELKAVESRLLAAMAAEGDFVQGLIARRDDLLGFAGAGGAAVLYDDRCVIVGSAPPEEQVRRLADQIADAGQAEVVAADAVEERFPGLGLPADRAAGVLAVSISKLHRSFLVWFRPEVVRTVTWAGDPTKAIDPDGRIHPRKSFETWQQTVVGRSLPWRSAEVTAAADLRNDIVGIVLRKAEERAALTAELERSNKELESFSYSVSHDLRAPFRHIAGYTEMLRDRAAGRLDPTDRRYLDTIADSAKFAGRLVDNLLKFSQMGRSALTPVRVDLNALVGEVRGQLAVAAAGREVEWAVGPLPAVRGDLVMLRLVFQNLLENALKFTAKKPAARIEVGSRDDGPETVVWVTDNGTGFDMRYKDKLFGVFQRLHRVEEYEGTGIGLANVRRISERHGGRVWAEGKLGEGATFFVALPKSYEGQSDGPILDQK
jgi:chemotaxis family two-component system sensor kinase Cph1